MHHGYMQGIIASNFGEGQFWQFFAIYQNYTCLTFLKANLLEINDRGLIIHTSV